MTKDLTLGKPFRLILFFTIPLLLGNVFQQFYNMADAVIVGNTISNEALAGVGATGSLNFLVIGFAQGLTAGFAVKTGQLFGAKDTEGVRRSVAASFVLGAILTVALTALSVSLCKPLLRLMNTPEDIFEHSYAYIVTIFWGIAATVFYNIVSNVLRALGDSKTPLYFLIFASLLNIGLDFLFILVFRMGVAGAGWATVLSQALSGFACLFYMLKKYPILRLKKSDFSSSLRFHFEHLAIGLPMALQFSITAVGVIVQQSALNKFGTAYVTAYSAASKIDNLATQPMIAVGTAIAAYCAQNYGAKRFDRIRAGVKIAAILNIFLGLFAFGLVTLLGEPGTKMFLSKPTAEIFDISREYLFHQGVFYTVLSFIFTYRNALQGVGKSALSVVGGGIELVMRILASIFLAQEFGFTGLCYSNPSAWVGAAVFFVIAYWIIAGRWKRREKNVPDAFMADIPDGTQLATDPKGNFILCRAQSEICDAVETNSPPVAGDTHSPLP